MNDQAIEQAGDFDPKDYLFVIDTDKYAGNFETDMCAFITGRTGAFGTGQEMATLFNESMEEGAHNPFEDKVWAPADDNGQHSPVTAFPTPGWFNNGMGGEFRDGQEAEAVEHRNTQYSDMADHESWNPDAPLAKHPGLMSVAIFFNQQPTDDEAAMLIERAKKFAAERPDVHGPGDGTSGPITVTGFRLLTEVTSYDNVKAWNI